MKNPLWILVLVLCSVAGCSAGGYYVASDFEIGQVQRRAIIRGEIREFLAAMEANALEAEKNAATSWFSRRYYLVEASNFYRAASSAASTSGQIQKAISYANNAWELAEKAEDHEVQIQAILVLARLHASLEQHAKAREWLEKVIGMLPQVSPWTRRVSWEGQLFRLMGNDFLRNQEFQKAIDSFSYSLQIQESRLDHLRRVAPKWVENAQNSVLGSLYSLASAYQGAGEFEDALKAYERGIEFVRRFGAKSTVESGFYQGLGEIYLQKKDFPRALENLKRAFALAESQQRSAALSSASLRIGDVFNQSGKPAEAIAYYQNAIQHVESTRSLLQSEAFRQSYFEGHLDSYFRIMSALLSAGKSDDAFYYGERARSRVFLDLLGNRVQLSRIKGGLLEEERALQERIAGLKASLSGLVELDEQPIDRASLPKALRAAEDAYSAFLQRVRKDNKEQASLMSVEPLTLKQVQELIDPGQTLIEYFVTETEMFVWVVEKDKFDFQRIAISKNELAKQLKTFREMISTLGDARELNAVSTSLYKSLIQPLLPHITGKELIIVPHDVLHYLPFQALLGSDGRYLIENYPISYLSSASLLQFTKEKSRAMGERVLALGNPDLGDPKMNLQFAGIEASEIKSLYPQSTVYLEKEATEEKAKSLSPQNDIIHFASHAELDENDPLSSAVLLAKSDKEDGRLEVREIFGMDLKASLVVLSACETGLGKLSSGDELVGLTRAFIYAGTPSVVASLWNVEDSSTAQLMASFYKNLKTMTKVEALRQAQLNLIRGNVNSDLLARRGIGGIGKLGEVPAAKSLSQDSVSVSTSHPFFWAPFILVGEGK
jgi:CHAT domain-containing protein